MLIWPPVAFRRILMPTSPRGRIRSSRRSPRPHRHDRRVSVPRRARLRSPARRGAGQHGIGTVPYLEGQEARKVGDSRVHAAIWHLVGTPLMIERRQTIVDTAVPNAIV